MSVLHHTPDCTGEWGCVRVDGRLYWRCGGCHHLLRATPFLTVAALRENALGATLRALSSTGVNHTERDPEDPL